MRNPFAKDDVEQARGRVENLEARLQIARQDDAAARERLWYAASSTTHDDDPDMLSARATMREAGDRLDELTAGLEIAERALAEAEEREAAERQVQLAKETVRARTKEQAATSDVDAALASLGIAYVDFREAQQAANTAARAADPAAGRMNVYALRSSVLGALWRHVPELAQLLELPFRSGAGGKRRALAEAVAISPTTPPRDDGTTPEAQAVA